MRCVSLAALADAADISAICFEYVYNMFPIAKHNALVDGPGDGDLPSGMRKERLVRSS
jgi:hypothetical protein